MRRGTRRLLGLLLFLALLGGGWLLFRLATADPGASGLGARPALPEPLRRSRPLKARLSGGFSYAPFPSGAAPGSASERRDLRRFTREADARALRGDGPEDRLQVSALLGLLRPPDRQRLERAIAALEAAQGLNPGAADVLNDLSAVLFAWAELAGEPLEVLRALNAADKALALAPEMAEARFNRAFYLQALGLRRAALAAWEHAGDEEQEEGWREEMRQHREQLARSGPGKEEIFRRMEAAARQGDAGALAERVRRFRSEARTLVEESLLPRWGEAWLVGQREEARLLLAAADAIAGLLAEVAADSLYREAVAAIRGAEERFPARLPLLAAGHRDFGAGVAAIAGEHAGEAFDLLTRSQDALAQAGSPFALRSQLKLAIAEHRLSAGSRADPAAAAGHRQRAEELLEGILALTGERSYPILLGDAWWMRGLMLTQGQQPQPALVAYRRAHRAFLESGELDRSAGIANLLAERHGILGEYRESWRLLGALLPAAGDITDPSRRGQLHANAATWALEAGFPEISLLFEAEALADAREAGNPWALLEAHRRRAEVLGRDGRLQAAGAALKEAQAALLTLPADQQALPAARLAVLEGNLLLAEDPAAAAGLLEAALDTYQGLEYRATLPATLLALGRARRAGGDPDGAAETLAAAVTEAETTRASLGSEGERIAFFHLAEEAVDELVALELAAGRPQRAFATSERKRARALRDRWEGGDSGEGEPLDELARRLGPGRVLVEYTLAGGELSAWVLLGGEASAGGFAWVPLRISREDLAGRVRRLRELVAASARWWPSVRTPFEAEARALHRDLIKPLEPWLTAAESLVLVPEGPLFALPFAALLDEGTGRYLVEDFALAASPSAGLFGEILARAGGPASLPSGGEVAVFGNPAFDEEAYTELGRIRRSAAEAREVAALYGGEAVVGEEATEERFLAVLDAGPRLVHFAGHALDNPAFPGNSRLLFTPAPGEEGSERGALTAAELAGHAFPGTELVVLSGCRTAGELAASAEGVRNLARPFLAGGVPAVVASLADVQDPSAGPLMARFHRELRAGRAASEALRAAQRSLLAGAEEELRPPAHWAVFQLLGEVRFAPAAEAAN